MDGPRCILDCRATHGEGPMWVEREQALYWVDIEERRIFRRAEADGAVSSWEAPFMVSALAPRAGGGFVAATGRGFALVDPPAGRWDPIADPEQGRDGNRFNDAKTDREGRFWAGTMDGDEEEPTGALYRLDPDGGWCRADAGYVVSNGPAFSPDGRTMYHNHSPEQTVFAFDLAEDGTPSGRRVLVRLEEEDAGFPDGVTVDSEGCLWIAFFGGWCVRRFAPDGRCLLKVDLPVEQPTSCHFGGPNLDRLYVTSARKGLDEEALARQPRAGGLFLIEPGVRGIGETPFAG